MRDQHIKELQEQIRALTAKLEEADQTGLGNKVIPIDTPDFEGEARIEFDKIIGKHNMHRFWVRYHGRSKKTGEELTGNHLERLDVYPFDVPLYKTTTASGKDLVSVLSKSAPRWVDVDQLQPVKETDLMREGMEMVLSGELDEKLKPSMGISAYIDDFVHSKNKRFAGKSKEQRIKMAKGAFYGAQRNEAADPATQEKTDYDAGYRFYIVDKHTKKIVGKAKTLAAASRSVDKRDNAYGAYRYTRRRIEQGLTEEATDIEHLVMTPELLLRTMEWAKESGGEDIQLHKYVEAMSELQAQSGLLDSDSYEKIISMITPNDPSIKDEGPGSSEENEH